MVSNQELRSRARRTLGNQIFSNTWLYALLLSLLVGLVIGLTTSFLLGLIIAGVLEYGHSKYYLLRSRNLIHYDSLMVVTDGVKEDVGGNIILGLLSTLFVFLWSLLFIIPGIVKAYSYSMAYFIKVDHPEYTPTQALDESKRIMDGNKMKLFMLDLSFIGWLILGSLTFGIGTLWVTPYMKAAHAEFYRDIIGE